MSHELTICLSDFELFLSQWNGHIIKGRKPDNFESRHYLKLSFVNIRSLRSNSVECESFLESKPPEILALCETDVWQYLCEGLSSFSPKAFCYSYAWSCSLCEGRTSFCTVLISTKLYEIFFVFSTGFTSFSVLFLFRLSITFSSLCTVFDAISTHQLICLCLKTLTPIIRTNQHILMDLIELVNSVLIVLSQMTSLRWFTLLFPSLTVTLIVLLFWIYFFIWR